MAQYYTSRPRHASTSTQQSSITLRTDSDGWGDDLNTSAYIFPNPSSLPPSPDSQSSALSTPTNLPFSPFPETPSEDQSVSPSPIGKSSQLAPGPWQWPSDTKSFVIDTGNPLHPSLGPRAEKKPLDPEGRLHSGKETYLSTRDLGVPVPQPNHIPQALKTPSKPPRAHVPFLSFFASLLSVDESTLELLTSRGVEVSYKPVDSEVHGMDKFILALSEESPLFLSPIKSDVDALQSALVLHMPDMLGIVTEMGGRLLRVVFRV